MTELATWDRSHGELVDCKCSPWDDADRRPSHADRRNFLRRALVAKELNDALRWSAIPEKIRTTQEELRRLAA